MQLVHSFKSGHNLGPSTGRALTDFTESALGTAAGAVKKAFRTARNRADAASMNQNAVSAALAFFRP